MRGESPPHSTSHLLFKCNSQLLHPPWPPKIRGENSATFFVCKNASSPCILS